MTSISPQTLRTVGLATFTSMAATRICDPMLVELAKEFQVSQGDASSVISAYAIAYGVLQLVYGPFGDRLGKLRVIVFATFACAVFSALTAAATQLPLLVWGRAAMGAAAAGIIPLTMAWVGDQVPYDQRQETLAKLLGATVTGMMLGQWFGGVAAEHLSWRVAFASLAVLFFVAGWKLKSHVGQTSAQVALAQFSLSKYMRQSLGVFRIPRVRWVLTMTGIEGAIAFGTLSFAPSQLVGQFGVSAATAGGVMMLYGVGGLVYSQWARRWIALLGERGLALTGGALIATGLLLLAWANQLLLGALACMLSGLGFYMLHNTLQTQATQMAPDARGVAVTYFASVLFLGQSLGVMLIASSLDSGTVALSFTAAAMGVVVLSWIVSRGVKAKNRR